MRVLPVDSPEALSASVRTLDSGGLVVLPTGQRYALAADALDEEALARAFRAKGRSADRGFPVVLPGVEDVQQVAFLTPLARALAERHWPGPLLLVLRARPWLPDTLVAGGETVALACPEHPFARALAARFGPLALTGAHRQGQPPILNLAHAQAALGAHVDLLLEGGLLEGGAPTVVDARGDVATVLHEGAIAADEVAPDG